MARMLQFNATSERELAAALRETAATTELTARLAGAQINSVQWTLAVTNYDRCASGISASKALPTAVKAANQGFALLFTGLAPLWPIP